jgi:hypothetical protein
MRGRECRLHAFRLPQEFRLPPLFREKRAAGV